ncbi:Uncharacterized protein Y057_14438 [Fusarium fujikuroi]|nr:Uncharacterized protein Y057_14438 [Fusarium fujikuroi]
MAQSIPKTVKQWTIPSRDGKDFSGLKFSEESVPELGDGQVLVKSKFQLHFTPTTIF